MRTNVAKEYEQPTTHEGAVAPRLTAERELRRSVMACMLWEDTFYESGQSIADRISGLVAQLPFSKVGPIAVEARERMKLRHAPLLLLAAAAKPGAVLGRAYGDTIKAVIQRPDEMGELLAILTRERKTAKKLNHIHKQVRIGLARAFHKFDEYSLAKYDRDAEVKLRDVLFLCHAKPRDEVHAAMFKRVVERKLQIPDTWETALSGGADKKETFERLIRERKLGGLAFLRNLRGMFEAGVDEGLVRAYLGTVNLNRVLPFRFISAARYAPKIEDAIEGAMFRALAEYQKLPGKTAIVVDNSGSMHGTKVSARSEIDRSDAACALAILIREVCENALVIGFGGDAQVIPARRGFALRDAIKSGPGGGTNTDTALALAEREGYDRVVVVTDEQSHQSVPAPRGVGYFINVASYQNGIGYGPWTHIDGWSEAVLEYIRANEATL